MEWWRIYKKKNEKEKKISSFFLEGISAMTYKKEKKDFDLDFVSVKEWV
jgi:hypothetical protein